MYKKYVYFLCGGQEMGACEQATHDGVTPHMHLAMGHNSILTFSHTCMVGYSKRASILSAYPIPISRRHDGAFGSDPLCHDLATGQAG